MNLTLSTSIARLTALYHLSSYVRYYLLPLRSTDQQVVGANSPMAVVNASNANDIGVPELP